MQSRSHGPESIDLSPKSKKQRLSNFLIDQLKISTKIIVIIIIIIIIIMNAPRS